MWCRTNRHNSHLGSMLNSDLRSEISSHCGGIHKHTQKLISEKADVIETWDTY